jgi:hypothetical protein
MCFERLQYVVLRWVASTCIAFALLGCTQKPAPPDAAPPANLATEGLATPSPRDTQFRRGVSLGLFVSNPDPEYRRVLYAQMLDEIAATGATDLQLVIRWAQQDIHSHDLTRDPDRTAPDALLGWVMDAARQRKLRVFLMPIVHLNVRAKGHWRGTLEPTDLHAWWRAYTAFIEHYARLAQRHQAALFAVGSELVSQERHRDRWLALILRVRKIFPGPLTYSANWDHFEPVHFWPALDVIGVTAYQPLSATNDPDQATLQTGWRTFRQRLRRLQRREGKPYLLTEVGYPANADGARRPWDYRPRGAATPDLQTRCFRALFAEWHDDPHLAGLYVWNWFGTGGPSDPGYSPRERGAEAVLRHWYLSPSAARSPGK